MPRALAALLGACALLLAPAAGSAALAPPSFLEAGAVLALRPPPREPEHGHRHAHRSGALLRYDARLGVYAVQGAPGVWFFADAFLRERAGRWEFSAEAHGPWSPGRPEWVPVRLRAALYRTR